jgi:anionic cell wall polymer biosynthesis LytR-Cps2A-Psr (LCP) family protein
MKVPSAFRKPVGAAALSAVFPGLGQAAVGQRRRGAILAIPALALLGAILLVLLFARSSVYGLVVDQTWLTSLLLLDLVAVLYHVWVISDAYLEAGREHSKEQRRRKVTTNKWPAIAGIGIIVVLALAPHAVFASVDMSWQHTLDCLTAKNPCQAPGGPVAADSGQNDYLPSLSLITPSPDSSGGSAAPASALPTYNLADLPSFPPTQQSLNWAADGQLNVLLLGVGVGGDDPCPAPNQDLPCRLGPDTLLVLHVDLASGKAAMISVGRNFICDPLPQEIATHFATSLNGCPPYTYPYMLNSVGTYAWSACSKLPYYPDTCGQTRDENAYQRAIMGFETTIGTMLGLTIDGTVTINPVGLTTLIDDLGGVDINVQTRLYDKPCGPAGTWQNQIGTSIAVPGNGYCADAHNGYSVPTGLAGVAKMRQDAKSSGGLQSVVWSQSQDVGFIIQPGQQHMDGDWALAYARTRIYTNDFARQARQQDLLKAIRADFDPCALLPKLPSLIGDLGWAFHTDLPLTGDTLRTWANLAHSVLGSNVKSIVLNPPDIGMPYVGGYPAVDQTSWAKIKDIVAHSLDTVPAAGASGSSGGGGGGLGC